MIRETRPRFTITESDIQTPPNDAWVGLLAEVLRSAARNRRARENQEKKTRPTAGEKQPTADVPHGTDDTTQDAGKASQGGYCDRNG